MSSQDTVEEVNGQNERKEKETGHRSKRGQYFCSSLIHHLYISLSINHTLVYILTNMECHRLGLRSPEPDANVTSQNKKHSAEAVPCTDEGEHFFLLEF